MVKKVKGLVIYFLMFLGVVLSVIKVNGWIVIPTFCIVFCWITSIFSWFMYSYAKGLSDGINKELLKKISDKDNQMK